MDAPCQCFLDRRPNSSLLPSHLPILLIIIVHTPSRRCPTHCLNNPQPPPLIPPTLSSALHTLTARPLQPYNPVRSTALLKWPVREREREGRREGERERLRELQDTDSNEATNKTSRLWPTRSCLIQSPRNSPAPRRSNIKPRSARCRERADMFWIRCTRTISCVTLDGLPTLLLKMTFATFSNSVDPLAT